jgi:hypothetical protein
MEDQLARLVDKVWEMHVQTPPDRRLCKYLFPRLGASLFRYIHGVIYTKYNHL